MEYAIYCYEEKEKELKEKLKKETDHYKKNSINSELKKVQSEKRVLLKEFESPQSEPSFCEGAYGRNSLQGLKLWQVLKSVLVLPLLGRFKRPFSLKPLRVEGKWKRQIAGLVPSGFGGTT